MLKSPESPVSAPIARRPSCTTRQTALNCGLIALVVLVSSACTSPQPKGEPQLTPIAPIVSRPDGSVRVETQSREVANLWASAERARSEGKNNIALELIYEALEIDAQNSLLWSRAAEIKLDALEPALAENYATKSNAWAGDNRPLLYRNWLIIEHARSMRGDLLGVRSAHKQAQLYQVQ